MTRRSGQKLSGSVIHGGREYHAGEEVPDGVDLERLKRLGLIGERPEGEPEHGTRRSRVPAERPREQT